MTTINEIFNKDTPEIALKSLFSKYDEDKDGKLNPNELSNLLITDFGLEIEQAEVYAYILDKDGDNLICYEEFKEWIRSEEKLVNVTDQMRFLYLQRAIEYFQKYDTDNNLSLDRSELCCLLVECGGAPEHLQAAMDHIDADKNGRVSFQEFLIWLNWAPLKDLFAK